MTIPLPENEIDRLKALRRYQILDTLPEKDFDDITSLASYICDTPIALITLLDETRQWFKSKAGLAIQETSRDVAFCSHAIVQDEMLIVKDALADDRFAANPLVLADPNIRFYAGAQLTTPDGYNLGTLCVIDRKPRELTPEQIAALQALARQVAMLLEFRRVANSLQLASKAHEELIAELQEALTRIKTLEGIIPICTNCKYVRHDEGYWQQLEIYIRDHSDADFTHGFCPNCMNELYPELYNKIQERREEILGTLKKLGSANLKEIALAVNLPESNTLNRLQGLIEEGQVKCLEVDSRELYMLP